MTRQNRVTPSGTIIASPERGTLMGNRGCLHDEQGRIRRPWQGKRWLLCLLAFKDRKRTIMTPGRYTELFFLDEATGLAAGHRPCFECRRTSYIAFWRAWLAGNPEISPESLTIEMIDSQLHAERVGPERGKRTFTANLDELPDGVFVSRPEWGEDAYLLHQGQLLAWSPGGYRQRRPLFSHAGRPSQPPSRPVRPGGLSPLVSSGLAAACSPGSEQVMVLTPRSTVAAIRAGYVPLVHESARLPG